MTMNRKATRASLSALSLLLLLTLSTIVGLCSAGASDRWSQSPISRFSRRERVDRPNLFASGFQKTISRSTERRSPQTLLVASNNVDADDESRQIRNAFIDHEDEATEIKHTMRPHLKQRASSESDTQAVIKAAAMTVATRPLMFWENMVSGAVSRSIAQTVMHPANTMKTIMQSSLGPNKPRLVDLMKPTMFRRLTCGAGANFVLSLPHGAFNFAVLEAIREKMNTVVASVPKLERNKERIGPGLDFMSSSIATICCSVVSTPQMMITDNIMAGNYPNLLAATSGLYSNGGVLGFYSGWWPGLVGKIPSYALTWTFFQQIKRVRNRISDRPAKNHENTIMGCMASATTVCIMIPMDTIKTRLVTQSSAKVVQGIPYKGIVDCGVRIAKEEGIKTFYRGLAPRLMSVVPMIGIQFGVYEAMKKVMLQRSVNTSSPTRRRMKTPKQPMYEAEGAIEEAAMETAASQGTSFPAPHFLNYVSKQKDLQSLFGFRIRGGEKESKTEK